MAKQTKNNLKENEGKETVEFFKDLDKTSLNAEMFLEKYAKQIGIAFGVVLLGILGYFGYQQFIIAPKNEEAVKAFLVAQKNLTEGKNAEALGGKSAANPGFMGVAKDYSSTKVGKLSSYNAGIIKFKEGKFQEAYDLMDQFSSDNKTLMAMKFGVMADAKSGLNKNDEALGLLDKAASASTDPYTIYYFTRKAGILALGMKKNAEAKKYFATIDEKYQDYDNGMSDSYIEMTKYY